MDDKELLEGFSDPLKKNHSFNLLVRKYQQRVYWHIRKMVISHEDTDDLTQEVFVKIWKNLDSFRNDSKLFTWIYRIATNECLNFLSKKKRRFFLPIVDLEKDLNNQIESSPYIDGVEIQIKLQRAVLNLPQKQQLVFNMKYYDNLKYEEISEILGTSVGALKASYHLAVKKIEDFLNNS